MDKFKVKELKGINSLRAFNAFHTLMLGLKMLPAYSHLHYEQFYDIVDKLEHEAKIKLIREAALFVELTKDEIESFCAFVCDANGIPVSKENIKNFGPDDLIEIIVLVCGELAKIKIDLVSDDEKKKLQTLV